MITRLVPEMVRYDLGPLLAMARTFGRSPSQGEGLRLALTQATALTGASAGFIQTVRDDCLQLAAQVGLSPGLAEGLRELRDGHGLETMGRRWEELLSFSPDDGDLPSDLQSLLRVEGVTSGLLLPLRAGGPLRGLLVLLTQSPDRLTPGDPHLLVALGRWVGLTLDRAALEEEVHRQAEQIRTLTSQHARLHKQLQAGLEELRGAQLQLIQSEKFSAIGQLVSGVAHELNNPLTTILGNAQLLISEPSNPQMRRRHERINQEALRCARIVENLLTAARATSGARLPRAEPRP